MLSLLLGLASLGSLVKSSPAPVQHEKRATFAAVRPPSVPLGELAWFCGFEVMLTDVHPSREVAISVYMVEC